MMKLKVINLSDPEIMSELLIKLLEEALKKRNDIHVSILEFWGYLLQELLEPNLKFRLSDSRRAVAKCQLPFPLFTAASVNKDDATNKDSGEFLFLASMQVMKTSGCLHPRDIGGTIDTDVVIYFFHA